MRQDRNRGPVQEESKWLNNVVVQNNEAKAAVGCTVPANPCSLVLEVFIMWDETAYKPRSGRKRCMME